MPKTARIVHVLWCCFLALATALTATHAPSTDAQDMRRTKKLISTGWDKPDTATLRQNIALMEQRPFDGVVFEAIGQVDEKTHRNLRYASVNEEWKRQWFEQCVEDLRACKFTRFTDNFVLMNANPGSVDWFDDAGWKNIVDHWRIAAWLAREGKVKGILFDPEPYHAPYAQFKYEAQAQRDKHSFNDYYAKARERGREIMRAVAEEYPDLVLFCYFMNSVCGSATGAADPRDMLSGLSYGLYPPFIDGWLDVAPATVTFVDGCESAYLFNSAAQYLEASVQIKGDCQEFVSLQNRPKYRTQVQVSFGMYLDAYWNPKDSEWGRWYIDGLGGSRTDRLRGNIGTALRVADEYVWVYGEKFRWWPTTRKGVRDQTWDEALPGITDILQSARDPIAFARAKLTQLSKSETLTNLARNGDFASDKAATNEGAPVDWRTGGAPAGWSVWQEKTSKGVFEWDREIGAAQKGSARCSNVANGCFIQSINAQPGERYAVRALCRLQGKGTARIRVRWQTSDSIWVNESLDRFILGHAPPREWGELFGVVHVPEGTGKLIVLLGVSGQTSSEDVVWYDDVGIYRLE